MMKFKFLIILLLLFNISFSQNEKNKSLIDDQIKRINWTSFQVVTNYFIKIVLNDSLTKNLCYKDSTIINKLFDSLTTDSKTVAIHIMLTKILEPQKDNFKFDYKNKKNLDSCNYVNNQDLISYYYNDNKNVNVITYCYNNLKWSFNLNTNQYKISKTEIRKTKQYWKKIINKTFKNEQ